MNENYTRSNFQSEIFQTLRTSGHGSAIEELTSTRLQKRSIKLKIKSFCFGRAENNIFLPYSDINILESGHPPS